MLSLSCSLALDPGEVTYEAKQPRLLARLRPPLLEGAHFGHVLAVDDMTVVVAATGADVGDVERAGRVFVFDLGDGSESPVEIALPNPSSGDGKVRGNELPMEGGGFDDWSGIQIDIDQRFIVIGMASKDANDTSQKTGAVYVYERADLRAPMQHLDVSGLRAGDLFGFSVALSGDWLAASAPGHKADTSSESAGGTGAVYVFQKREEVFSSPIRLEAPNDRGGDFWGAFVSLDGDVLAVGEPTHQENRGIVDLFRLHDDRWEYERSLEPPNSGETPVFFFGSSLAISGETIAVGAPLTAACAGQGRFPSRGAVYVFGQRPDDSSGSCLSPAKATPGLMGWSIAFDGQRLLSGAPFSTAMVSADSTGESDSEFVGAAYLYERNDAGTWAPRRNIRAPTPSRNRVFGSSVGLGPGFLAIGAARESGGTDGPGSSPNDEDVHEAGAVFVYEDLDPSR